MNMLIVLRKVIVLKDTTNGRRSFGLMVFKEVYGKENLLFYYVKLETKVLYITVIKELKSKGFDIIAIVCDGRKGLVGAFEDISVQLCQFH